MGTAFPTLRLDVWRKRGLPILRAVFVWLIMATLWSAAPLAAHLHYR